MRLRPPSRVVRLGRLLRPGRNPLARGADRTEGTVAIVFVLLALVLVPVMLTLGTLTSASLAERSAQENRTRHQAVAVLVEDAQATSAGDGGEAMNWTVSVPARWQLADGTTRTGPVSAEGGLAAGTEVPIWLDESGDPTDPPLSAADYVGAGVFVTVFGWLFAAGLFAFAFWVLHHALNRRRYRDWDAEWARFSPHHHA